MSYGMESFGDPELDGLDFEELEGEEFGDLEDFEAGGPSAGGPLARIDAETAALMMDVAAELAAEADSEEEADAFLPIIAKLAPMALKALAPLAKTAISKIAPALSRGVMSAGRKMLQNVGRQGVAALPNIARGVARDSLKTVAQGGNLTGRMVMRSAAHHTLPYLQDPRRARQAAVQCRRRLSQAPRFRHRPPPPPMQQPYGGPYYGAAPDEPPTYPSPYDSPYGPPGYDHEPGPPEATMPEPHYPQWFS